MKPIEHIDMALKLLKERDMMYSDIWDCLIACKDDLHTIVQQPLSGSADASPKSCPGCRGKGKLLGFPKEQTCYICNGTGMTSDNGKRWLKLAHINNKKGVRYVRNNKG